ncbi:MAG TPA: sigma-70 family RNA polymerase sigma factor [Kofleriaceae bacterium]
MRRSLAVSVGLFSVVVTVQIVLHLAALVFAALVIGATEVLLHTGGLDTETFSLSLYVGLSSALALVLGLRVRGLMRRSGALGSTGGASVGMQHRVKVAAITLLLILAAVTLLGWHRSAFFPYPLATIVVIANVAFFGVLGPAWLGRLAFRLTRRLLEVGARSQYIAGATTAALVLLSAAGIWSANIERHRIAAEVVDIEASGRFEQLSPPTSFADASEKGLCLVGEVLQPALAASTAGCGFTARPRGPGGWGDDSDLPSDGCTTTLHGGPFQQVQAAVVTRFRLSEFDANEVTMRALLITCAKEPPPRHVEAYFRRVASNEAARFFSRDAQLAGCDDELANVPDTCATSDLDDAAAEKGVGLFERVECELGTRVMRVIRLRAVDDLSFAEIGDRLQIDEDTARYTFHNAIKKLRNSGVLDCFRE